MCCLCVNTNSRYLLNDLLISKKLRFSPSASRKQRRPPPGEDFHRAGSSAIQAGLPHVGEEPGTGGT